MSSLLTQQLVNYDYVCHNRSNNNYKTYMRVINLDQFKKIF